jgi:hypothetical protein
MIKRHTTKKLIALSAAAFIILLSYQTLKSNQVIPPDIFVGNPNSAPGCAEGGCHGGGQVNVGSGTFTIASTATGNTYVTDSTYSITFTVSESTKTRFGFEAAVLNSSLSSVGSMSAINTATTVVGNDGVNNNIQLAAHYNAGSNHVWTINWKAPHTYSGDITVYAFGNAANGNGNADAGDDIYRTKLVLHPAVASGIPATGNSLENQISIYPNPASDRIAIDLTHPTSEKVHVELLDMQMKQVGTSDSQTNNSQVHTVFDVSTLNSGIYFVRTRMGNEEVVRKVFISNHNQ